MKKLEHYHPFVIFIYFMLVTLLTMLANNPILVIISFLMAFLTTLILEKNKSSNHLFNLVFFALIFLTNPLFVQAGETLLFKILNLKITLEAVFYGLIMACRILGIIYWFRIFQQLLETHKILYLFGKLFPSLSLLITMVFSFSYKLKQFYQEVNLTQEILFSGVKLTLKTRIINSFSKFYSLVMWGLESSIETSQSMNSRGFGLAKRTNHVKFKWRRRDTFLLVITLLLAAGLVFLIYYCGFSYSYYPLLEVIEFGYFEISLIAVFTFFTSTIVIIDLKGRMKWQYLKSRI